MNPSTITLLITGVVAVIFYIIIIAVLFHQPITKGVTGRQPPVIPRPSFQRVSTKYTAQPLSLSDPTTYWPSISHPISPSFHISSHPKWAENTWFSVFPYSIRLAPQGVECKWGKTSSVYVSSLNPVSYDMVDADACTTTIIWQYFNTITQDIGSLTLFMVKGCPFVTLELHRVPLTFHSNDNLSVHSLSSHIVTFNEYVIIFLHAVDFTQDMYNIYIPEYTGIVRIGHYTDIAEQNILIKYCNVYPTECSIGTSVNPNHEKVDSAEKANKGAILNEKSKENPVKEHFKVACGMAWTVGVMYRKWDKRLLMTVLESQVENLKDTGILKYRVEHPVFGTCRYILMNDPYEMDLEYSVSCYTFRFPMLKEEKYMGAMKKFWKYEMGRVGRMEPVLWGVKLKWLGSLATMLLIGASIGNILNDYVRFFVEQLNILVSQMSSSPIAYDSVWGGMVSTLGLNDDTGCSEDGNSHYRGHLKQYGTLIYAFAVGGYFDHAFIQKHKDWIMYFVRDIMNPSTSDDFFPVFRYKDWYLGYSHAGRLSPYQRQDNDIGSATLGYYACYLLSIVLPDKELQTWSLTLLASELGAAKNPALHNNNMYESNANNNNNNIIHQCDNMLPISTDFISPFTPISYELVSWVKKDSAPTAPHDPNIDPTTLACLISLLGWDTQTPRKDLFDLICNNSKRLLCYGYTWTSVLYWILTC